MTHPIFRIGWALCGLGFLYIPIFFLGVFALFKPQILVPLAGVWVVGVVVLFVRSPGGWVLPKPAGWGERIFAGFILLLIFGALAAAAVPPTARDVLIHHLALPKIYLRRGALVDLPFASFSYYPMGVDMLYLAALAAGSDLLPAYLHLFFGISSALLIYLYLKERGGSLSALFGVAIFLSTPVIFTLMTVAYVDLALACFSLLSLLSIFFFAETKEDRWLTLAGVAAGLGCAAKYNGLLVLFFLSALLVALPEGRRGGPILRFGLFAGAVASPWIIRTLLLTRAPLSLGDESLPPLIYRMAGYGESLPWALLAPVRVFFYGVEGEPARFDGMLSPVLFLAPLVGLFFLRDPPFIRLLLFSIGYLLFAFTLTVFRARYLVPVVGPLAIASALAVASIPKRVRPFFYLLPLLSLYPISVSLSRSDPLPYLLGAEGREGYLARHLTEYPIVKSANQRLPPGADVFMIFTGKRGYYLEREYQFDRGVEGETLRSALLAAGNLGEVTAQFRRKGADHLLVNEALFLPYFDRILPSEKKALFHDWFASLEIIDRSNGFLLLRLLTKIDKG